MIRKMITQIKNSRLHRLENHARGQSTIEMAAAIIAVFIFLLGTLQIFVWFNNMIVSRQQYYSSSRLSAASDSPGEYSWQPQPLDIFGAGEPGE